MSAGRCSPCAGGSGAGITMERDKRTTLATKSDLQLIRQEMENRFNLVSRDIESLRQSTQRDLQSLRHSTARDIGAFATSMATG